MPKTKTQKTTPEKATTEKKRHAEKEPKAAKEGDHVLVEIMSSSGQILRMGGRIVSETNRCFVIENAKGNTCFSCRKDTVKRVIPETEKAKIEQTVIDWILDGEKKYPKDAAINGKLPQLPTMSTH